MDKTKIKNTTLNMLKVLGTLSLLGAAILMPNILVAADKIFGITGRKRFYQNMAYLRQHKYITISEDKNGVASIAITERGKRKLLQYNIQKMRIQKPRAWDNKWRMVMFDIPEKKKAGRNALSYKLKQLGFYHLQKSVFIHPYDCRKEIDFITHYFRISSCVSLIVAGRFDGDRKIQRLFNC